MQADRSETLKYNLSILKRRDAAISEVLDMAGHVVMYRFNEDSQSWDRKNVEGSLFVVARTSDPAHMFVVLNRLSSENLVEAINEEFQMELTEQFLLYRNASQEINGIWFYSAAERASMAELLQKLSTPAGDAAPVPDASSSAAQPTAATTVTASTEYVPPATENDPPATSPGGTASNVAQFFNMMQNQAQDVPPMPAAPAAPADSAEPRPPDAPPPTAAPVKPPDPPEATPAPAAAPQAPAGDVESLKSHLRTQLEGLLQVDSSLWSVVRSVQNVVWPLAGHDPAPTPHRPRTDSTSTIPAPIVSYPILTPFPSSCHLHPCPHP